MVVHITGHRDGFPWGRSRITAVGEADDVGLGFAVWRYPAGERLALSLTEETALLLMKGRVSLQGVGPAVSMRRASLFTDLPWCVHASAGAELSLVGETDFELGVFTAPNPATFPARLISPEEVRSERRGEGAVDDAALRIVRTIFDDATTPPEAELVLGEVLTLPGRWSSYPPHHHPQHEVYHYRFEDPRGYGHAELGDEVFKVRCFDTIKIQGGKDHAQCAAPGYAMYYAWVIRHLPDARYGTPEFTEAHRWTMEAGARGGWPNGEL